MKGWSPSQLSSFIKVKHGFAFSGEYITTQPTKYVLVTPGNFSIGGGFKGDKFKYFEGEVPNDYILKAGDLVVTMTDLSKDGDTLGYSAIIPRGGHVFLHNQRIGLIKDISPNLDKNFLHWLLRTQEYREYILGSATGTSVQHTSPITILKYTFSLPPLPEQKAIAAVLSNLDDKIDLLHRQNATLEAMAEALFRQWFVVEAKEEWESVPLSYFGKIICGKTPSKANKAFFDGEIPFIKIPDMHGSIFIDKTSDTLTEKGASSQSNKYIPPASICVSCIATVGLVSMTKTICQTNQQINTIVPEYSFYKYYLFFHLRLLKDELENMASGGTATPNLNTGDFSRIEILSPPGFVLQAFDDKVGSLFEKIRSNQTQIRTLETLRDTLLPKLMSGEVRVEM
jgi:type I restriction enzyme S subunit